MECTTADCLEMEQQEEIAGHQGEAPRDRELPTTIRQYETFIEQLPDAMVIVGRDGKIGGVNSQLLQLFGYAKEQLLGKNIEVLMPARFRAGHRRNVATYVAHPRIRAMGTGLDLFGLKKDGTEFPVDISLSYVIAGGEFFAMAAVRDITERKQVERKIELNYRTHKAIGQVLKISLQPLPLDEQLVRVLDLIISIPSFAMQSRGSVYLVEGEPAKLSLKAMHGFPVARVDACKTVPVGRGASVSSAICPSVATNCLDDDPEIRYESVGDAGRYCVPIVFGRTLFGLINVEVPVGRDRPPEEEEFLSAIANALASLIERHQTETAKIRLGEQLAETEKFSALGRISANVAHTIKNPLTVIGGFAEKLHAVLPLGSKENKYAGLILTESIRLDRILRNVLLFSRSGADPEEKCDLSEIVEKTLTVYEELYAIKSIAVQRSYEDVPRIVANREQVRQAVENIISNAIDAMPGGGTLTVATTREDVHGAERVKVIIKDTGDGIAAEDLGRIFEPFYSTKVAKKGTGLGLSITKKIVEAYGGFIRVDSRIGAGASFSLYFPSERVR